MARTESAIRQYLKFEWLVMKNVSRKVWRDFAPTREKWFLFTMIAAIGFGLQWYSNGPEETKNELFLTFLKSFLAPLITMAGWFVLRIFAEPYVMWSGNERALKELRKQQTSRVDHLEVARKLQEEILLGQNLMQHLNSAKMGAFIQQWRDRVDKVLEGVPAEDRAMFQTLNTRMPNPQSGGAARVYEQMMGVLITKLRRIMARAHRRAVGDSDLAFEDDDGPTD